MEQICRSQHGANRLAVDEITYVIQATASNEVTTWGVSAGHDPRRSQRNGVDFVGRVGVPDDELSILRGRDKVSSVGRPMHGVDFSKMAFQVSSGLHAYAR
jgi:hypothetical protein